MSEDSHLQFSVSYTTRKPRGLEKDGESYHFIDRAEFEERLSRGEFLEHAEVFGNYYGTNRNALKQAETAGKDLLLDIDVKGAGQLKEAVPDAVTIFVLPPGRDILEERLRSRSEDAEEVIQRRLFEAAAEIEEYKKYDYVLINQDLEETAGDLAAIVRAERVRRFRMKPRITPILESFRTAPTK